MVASLLTVSCAFPFFFGSNIGLIDRRDLIKAQSAVCVQPSVCLTSIMGLTVWSDFYPIPGQRWPHGNKFHRSRTALDRAPLCCKPSSGLCMPLQWILRSCHTHQGWQSAEPPHAPNLLYTLGGFKVRISGPAKLCRGEILTFAELCGLLCYLSGQSSLWQEKGYVCVELKSPFLWIVKKWALFTL